MEIKPTNKPLIKHITLFLEYSEIEKGLSQSSIKNYQNFLIPFVTWLEKNKLSNLLPHELTPDHIWNYRLYLSRRAGRAQDEYLKKSTQDYYLIALRGLLLYLTDQGILCLPADKVKLGKKSKERNIKFLNLEQMEKLLLAPDINTPSGLRDRAILELLFSTGLRVAELTHLNRDQLGLNTLLGSKGKDIEVVIIGKGGYQRVVFISDRAANWLVKYLNQRHDDNISLFINLSHNSTKNGRLTVRSIETIIKKYVIQCGLPLTTTPHTIRHSYATDLLEQGADLRTIQEFLGHKNIVTTQVYTHVTNRQLRDVHRAFHSGGKLKN